MALRLQLLGALILCRDGSPVRLPASRKLRALLAWLAMANRATSRQRLCSLLWESASDPRAELRWHLSKLRAVIGAERIHDDQDHVRLELDDREVDAREVRRAVGAGADALAPQRLRALHADFRGEFLEGLELDHCAEFTGWVLAERRRFRDARAVLLERLVQEAPQDEACAYIEKWIEIAPFEIRAHEHLFASLARRGRFREADEHLALWTRIFTAEGLDCAALRNGWYAAGIRGRTEVRRALPPRADEQAYEFYLLGHQHLARMMQQGLVESRRMFGRAIELDPGYAPAWAGLAMSHVCTHEWFDAGMANLEQAEAASRRALEAGPRLAEAHTARAFVLSQSQDYDNAVSEFEEAIRLNPYLFDAYYYYARAAFARGDMQRAADMFHAAEEVRCEDFQSGILLAMPMDALGKEDAGRDALRRGIRRAELMLALNPGDGRALSLGAGALLDDGQEGRALEWSRRVLELYPRDTSALLNVACLYAKADERDSAMSLLDQVFARGFGKRGWVAHDPDYDNLRHEPRFQRMLDQLK